MFPSFDLSSAQKPVEGLITAMIPHQIIIYNAFRNAASFFTLSRCVYECVWMSVCDFEEVV